MIGSPPPPTPVEAMPIVPAYAPPRVVDGSTHRVVPRADAPRIPATRGVRRSLSVLAIVLFAGSVMAIGARARIDATPRALRPIRIEPAMVLATLRLDGALVRGAARNWALNRSDHAHYGDPVPVSLTAYCLKGTTRTDRYVRQGIVAADPRVFPLGRFVELYVGRVYYGRFLVDDTGGAIHDAILDIWTPTCREARLFGRHRGTAVLVPRPRGALRDTLLTGKLGGAMSH